MKKTRRSAKTKPAAKTKLVAKTKPVAKKGAGKDTFRKVEDGELDRDLFDRNMATMEKYFPGIHQKLSATEQTQTHLIVNDDGDYDIEFRGDRLFGTASREWAKKRVRDFDKKVYLKRLELSPISTDNLDRDSNLTVYRVMYRGTKDHGITFADHMVGRECFHFVVFGVGLGDHIPLLAKETFCQHLVLIEPNLEFLYLSMFTFDWDGLFKDFYDNSRRITLIVSDNYLFIADNVRSWMRFIGACFIEGSYLFKSYPSSPMQSAFTELLDNPNLFIVGFGFLEDEIDMIRNSYRALKKFEGRYYKKCDRMTHIPAFVIGAGPSLDNDLEMIRENQGRAIIISCGTALRILLHNGIVPDFHMEMENVPVVADLLSTLKDKFDFSKTTLVASNTVDPRVPPLFDRAIVYFRGGLSSFAIFSLGDDTTVPYAMPTVSNLGFSFAQEIGCREIYLFGIDLGARDPKKHHAKDSAYYTDEVDFDTEINRPVPGNFGGTVMSEFIYLWSRDAIRESIRENVSVRSYYNCSDGVEIKGAIPKLSSTVSLADTDKKEAALEEIITSCPEYTHDTFEKSWSDAMPRRRIRELRNILLECCDAPPIDDLGEDDNENEALTKNGLETHLVSPDENKNEDGKKKKTARKNKKTTVRNYELDFMVKIIRQLVPAGRAPSTEEFIYRGTVLNTLAALYYYIGRTPVGKKRGQLIDVAKDETIKLIIRVANLMLEFYNALEDEKGVAK